MDAQVLNLSGGQAAALLAACPGCEAGTVVLTDAAGEPVGYGRLSIEGGAVTLTLQAAPQGVSWLRRRPAQSSA